ncbi:MAG: TRAP transporter permease [Pseudomonadota bacterium]
MANEVELEPEIPANDKNALTGWQARAFAILCVLYAAWHLYSLNIAPLETWLFRILHIGGALVLGFGLTGVLLTSTDKRIQNIQLERILAIIAAIPVLYALCLSAYGIHLYWLNGIVENPETIFAYFGMALGAGTVLAILGGWFLRGKDGSVGAIDWVLIAASLAAIGFIALSLDALGLRLRAGTPFADPQNAWAAFVVVILMLELTRRVAGLALVVIASVFVGYTFLGPWLPGFLEHRGYDAKRFFSYVFTDNGILGPTTAVSSTYIILFIIFAAFLQSSKVGDYFVNLAFATAGRARGGPAKVAVFASGLMGMINGTSAGNVVSTGSLTIPLMKRVGYRPQSAGAIEAAASTGGQIMPPIMGAGAFIMAEITGIPYTELVVAALIPAVLYFVSIYFMVDFEARRLGMRGMTPDELPKVKQLLRQAFLFIPIIILVGSLFLGYSVIRAGTLAIASAAVVSWFTPFRMGPRQIIEALRNASQMSVQIITVCATAGIIVGVISLTGVGARFSSLLFELAETSKLLALIFAMVISIILGMGMPTTAAYAVAASVVAPGLISLGIEPLIAHFFVFYFAVVSAITPPVALASYAGAAIAGAEPMRTSVTSFRVGLAAFIVPYMFFYSPGLLMEASWFEVIRNAITAIIGVYFLSGAVQGYLASPLSPVWRILLLGAALCMISGDWRTDIIGVLLGAGLWFKSRRDAGTAQPEPQAAAPSKPAADAGE